MRSETIFAPNCGASANRRRNIAGKVSIASFALFAMLVSANGAPLRDNNHHHSRGGYALSTRPPASPPIGAWSNATRKPVYIFGQPVDP